MKRRTLLGGSVAGGMALGGAGALGSSSQTQAADSARSALPPGVIPSAYAVPHSEYGQFGTPDYFGYANDLVIERNRQGKPHQGKVLAAIQAHSDDIPIFCGGTIAKLINEEAEAGGQDEEEDEEVNVDMPARGRSSGSRSGSSKSRSGSRAGTPARSGR